MIMTVIIPSRDCGYRGQSRFTTAAGEASILRLVAAWLLGYESPATRRNYGADLAAWLGFCDSHDLDPCKLAEPTSMPGRVR